MFAPPELRVEHMSNLHRINGLNPGQVWARTRWNTHGSGAAFDRKKQRMDGHSACWR